MLIMPIPMRRFPLRTPTQMAGAALVATGTPVVLLVLWAAGRLGGTPGIAGALIVALAAIGAALRRHRRAQIRARLAWLHQFDPRTRYAAAVLTAAPHHAVQPFRAAGLPPLRVVPSAVDAGVWPVEGGALGVRVPMLSGMHIDQYSAAAGPLARELRVSVVAVYRERRTVVFELWP
ncbi:hypothetical protein [Nocardia nova]